MLSIVVVLCDMHSLRNRCIYSLNILEYLLDDDIESNPSLYDSEHPSKYGRIIQHLTQIYNHKERGFKVHQGFHLYITGHR